MDPSHLPGLITDVKDALKGKTEPMVEELKPAVPIKKSILPEFIICLEDGKKFKSLKRHLQSEYSMTPQQYREKWGLPADYPMVAPKYAEERSALAKKMGLGRRPEAAPPVTVAPVPTTNIKGGKASAAKASMKGKVTAS